MRGEGEGREGRSEGEEDSKGGILNMEKRESCSVALTLRERMLGRLPLCSSFSPLWVIVSTS